MRDFSRKAAALADSVFVFLVPLRARVRRRERERASDTSSCSEMLLRQRLRGWQQRRGEGEGRTCFWKEA